MSFLEVIQSQLVEPFRIVLLIGLVVTTLRTSEHTGHAIPLALGILFVAVISTMTHDGDRLTLIATGVVANAILVAVVLALAQMWMRFGRSRS
ncbi:MAG: hypothetical protein ABTQ31_18240 [Rhizobiaceae bacterium]